MDQSSNGSMYKWIKVCTNGPKQKWIKVQSGSKYKVDQSTKWIKAEMDHNANRLKYKVDHSSNWIKV